MEEIPKDTKLTKRELEALRILCTRASVRHAAKTMGISKANMRNYIRLLKKKKLNPKAYPLGCQKFLDEYPVPSLPDNLPPGLTEYQIDLLKRYGTGQTMREIMEAASKRRGKELALSTIIQALSQSCQLIDLEHRQGDKRRAAVQEWLLENKLLTEPVALIPTKPQKIKIENWGPKESGRWTYYVYALMEGEKPVYIGATRDIYQRTQAHRHYFPNATSVRVLHQGPDAAEILRLHQIEVDRHQCPDNFTKRKAFLGNDCCIPQTLDPMFQ